MPVLCSFDHDELTMEPLNEPEPEIAWRAVLERDTAWDDRFVYAVASTRVYCRPTCPSRRPRRDRVRFFARPADAQAAGYRACLRCRPDGPADRASAVRRVCGYLDAHLETQVSLGTLGEVVGLSPWHLQRTFKALTGMTPRQYAAARRAERFKGHLRAGESVTDATYRAGYGSSRQPYQQELGMTPATYRRGGAGMAVRYTLIDSALGRLLVGATERGVCAVSLGESDAELERGLRAEYPRAAIERADGALGEWAAEIVERVAGRRTGVAVPLDVQATAFQWRVWQALQQIPSGRTCSYAEMARSLGSPRATRAVARACATNPVAVVVPCHRVVRADGGLGGYRWGVARKRRLLELERAAGERG